uniref:GAG-POL n=1 Tax=Oryza sativa subsp. japonica TaxID=39947 RepID=Q6F2H9_ORYSJ|nr:putative GAG-POL precursor [Oryza sativa Japonica Group]
MPISTGPPMTGNENAVAMNQDGSMSKNPPVETENGLSTTSKLVKDSDAAKSCPSDINHGPTKMTSEVIWDNGKEQGATPASDRFVGVIDLDPHEPSVLHLLEDCGSSTTSASREVLAIDDVGTSAQANAEAANQSTTPAQHIRVVQAIQRETPYDPVLNDDLERWTERLRESVTNLSNAFEEAATAAHQDQPPIGDTNGKDPERRELPRQATPPPRGIGDLRDQINDRREARRTWDDANRSRRHVSSRRHDRGNRPNEDRDYNDRERRGPDNTGHGRRRNDDDEGDRRRDNSERQRQDARDPGRHPRNRTPEPSDPSSSSSSASSSSLDRHPRRSRDRRQTTAPSAGCRAFGRSLCDVRWPERFRPRAIENYDGSTDPEEFLQVYSTVLYAAGADDNALANYLPSALKGSARSWLMHLPPYSISSWADLWQQRKNDKPKTGGEKKLSADASESSKKKNRKNGKRKAQAEVLAAEYANPPKRPDRQGSDTKKSWCPIHKTDRHSLEDCLVFKKSLEKHMAFEKGKRVRVVEKNKETPPHESDSAYPDSDLHVSHIFGGSTTYSSKREYKKVEREVCSTWQGAAP